MEVLLDESVRHRDLPEGHPEGPAPDLEALDVEHGGLVLRQQQHDVLPGQEPLETHLGLQIRSDQARILGQHKAKMIREITGSHDSAASAVMISNDDFHIATNTIQSRIVQLRLYF